MVYGGGPVHETHPASPFRFCWSMAGPTNLHRRFPGGRLQSVTSATMLRLKRNLDHARAIAAALAYVQYNLAACRCW